MSTRQLNYEALRLNPELRGQIVAAAHRQRSEEMGRLIARFFKPLFATPKLRTGRMLRRSAFG
jgi:hypothetical protein